MKNSPLISVIIPVYKVEKYLPECLDSLLAQTYRNFELICVNDGSPDNSQTILEQYAQKDSRIRIFQKENGGVSSARNFGLKKVNGEEVTFVDPDDFVLPQYLEYIYQAMQKSNAQISICGHKRVAEDAHWNPPEKSSPLKKAKTSTINVKEYSLDAEECPAACLSVWRVLFRKDVLDGLRFDERYAVGEDTVYLFQALRRTQVIAYTEEELYCYRFNRESVCMQTFSPKHATVIAAREETWNIAGDISDRLKKSTEEFLALGCLNVYSRMLEAHYPDKKLRESAVQKVREHRSAVYRMKTSPRWKLWDKTRLLCMMYLPAWLNGPVWHVVESLRTKHGDTTE